LFLPCVQGSTRTRTHQLALRPCGPAGRFACRTRSVAWPSAGAWPAGPAAGRKRAPGRGIRSACGAEGPSRRRVHRDGVEASVCRKDARTPRDRRDRSARTTRGARPTASAALLLFHLSVFTNAKLKKVTTNLKISKYKSCRGAIDLQLSQRATYVLINSLSGNVGRSCSFSTARVTVHSAFNLIFGQFALEIGMSANYEKCVPGNNEQLSYWQILNFYSEIWRTRKKTISTLKEI
jgi:hypothetical protein